MLAALAITYPSLCAALVVPLSAAAPKTALAGVSLPRVGGDGTEVDLGAALASSTEKLLLVFGTHAADFNTVEYMQRVRVFRSRMQAKGINRIVQAAAGLEPTIGTLPSLPC